MKIKMKVDAHHRISSGVSQAYLAGREYQVPQGIGDALVNRGVAEAIGGKKSSTSKDK